MDPKLKKYQNKSRILLIETPNYTNHKYKEIREKYSQNLQLFHKYYIKSLTKKANQVRLKLIGFDGTVKKVYDSLNPNQVIKDIQGMPMGHLVRPVNLSLFSDYHPKTTIQGLGYKDKAKAEETIKKIKDQPLKYQKQVLNTMIGRAKNHPNQTSDMRKAIKIFEKYLEKIKGNTN